MIFNRNNTFHNDSNEWSFRTVSDRAEPCVLFASRMPLTSHDLTYSTSRCRLGILDIRGARYALRDLSEHNYWDERGSHSLGAGRPTSGDMLASH
jgi:hypothetical protein